MTTDPIADYQEALTNLDTYRRVAERIVGIITDGATELQRWRGVRVANTKPAIPFPAKIARDRSIKADQWPTGQAIAEALAGYHDALHEVGNTYLSIPSDQKGVVRPPPVG